MRWVAVGLVGLAAGGCFKGASQSTPTCLQLGTCQCIQMTDCPHGLDCLNGQCTTLHPDAGPGKLGAPCLGSADCASTLCLPRGPGNGGLCTESCDAGSDCAKGWDCKASTLGPPQVCAPPFDSLCLPCNQDSDCNPVGDRCLTLAGKRACGRDCSVSPCPVGYSCTQVAVDGGASAQCVPTGGTCECTDVSVGLGRSCSTANAIGTCFGRSVCQADGAWAACDAGVPSPEVCDGIDNDCNGLVDQNDPGLNVSGLPSAPPYPQCEKGTGGSCRGSWECTPVDGGPFGWVCNARDPIAEICDGIDNDCDGVVDNGFKNDAGQYVDVHNCNACGYDCAIALVNVLADAGAPLPTAVACELRAGVPSCVPKQCAPGAYLFPPVAPVLCEKVVSSSCRPCVGDTDCAVTGDKCLTIGTDPGTSCAQNCDLTSAYGGCTGTVGAQDCCPDGYTCQTAAGTKLCIPEGNSCQCSLARLGITRSCIKTAGTNSCVGLETCTADAGWNACDTSKTIIELCDGQDNNCSGVIDGPFINTKDSGTYDTDEHCGNCQTNCVAQWSPSIQHAIGGCDAGPGRPPACAIFACTTTTLSGGGACRLDSDCATGEFCDRPYFQCVRSCNVPSDCGGNPCVGGLCTASCTSDSQCQAAFGAPSGCGGGTCSATYHWVDADKDPSNGCECPSALGVVETPDVYPSYPDAGSPYPDRNCDRINGVAATSLFVWSGSAQSQGTQKNPYRTIKEALSAFNPAVHTAILVAEGDYPEQVVLQNGASLYGGYSSDFFRRDVVSFPTVLEGPEPVFSSPNPILGAVNAQGISKPTVFAGFTVRGYDVTFRPAAGQTGKSSYGIYVKDSTAALVIANNHVYGGRGGDGAPGAPGVAGGNGGTGGPGRKANECRTESCSGESQAGGFTGNNPSCPSATGNPGAGASGDQDPQGYPSNANGNGMGGFNATYQHTDPSQNNLCKYDCIIPGGGLNGGPAQDGPDGEAQAGGVGCSAPAGGLAGAEWQGGGGGGGNAGAPGTGGGGGGAGGCVQNANPPGCTIGNLVGDLGATGGGGGAGGCGGSAGGPGGAGGGSFAIFVVFTGGASSLPVVQANLIDVGTGGFGGNGGPGGYGGLGGPGGEAGTAQDPSWCAGNGGHGGRGGNGGAGSGGGGGCGGVAFGVAGNQLAGSGYGIANAFDPVSPGIGGSPGTGGASPAGTSFAGGSGSGGIVAPFKSF